MKVVYELPKEGQFVAVWSFNNKPYSDTFKWEDGEILVYSTLDDKWHREAGVNNQSFLTSDKNFTFYTP